MPRPPISRPRVSRFPVPTACWALLFVCGCSNGGAGVARVEPTPQVRIETANSGGDGDRLAAELLLVAGSVQTSPLRPAFALPHAGLRDAIEATALDHLRTVATTDGVGPDLAGSQAMRRLALEPGAPLDRNGNGTNLDETVASETRRIAGFAGAGVTARVVQPFLPWVETSAALEAPLPAGRETDPEAWRVVRPGRNVVRLEHLAAAMRLRAMAAGELLRQTHGVFVGSTADKGRLGLLATQQLLAAEETLLGALSTDSTTGGPLGPVPDPAEYDPDAALRWFPAAFAVLIDPALPGIPTGYTTADVASDLVGLSLLLQAAAETVWVAGAANPSPSLRAVFRGEPFPEPKTGPPPPPVLSWQQDVAPVINFNCGPCHTGTFPKGQFNVGSLASLKFGSPRTRLFNLEMIVPFDHATSFLWRIVTPPPPQVGTFQFQQMPLGTSGLPEAQRNLIANWIDAGALEFPPQAPPPPVAGQDLLRVCFVNLVAMHFDATTGALHHRHEGDGPSGVATAVATGAALRALQAADAVMPDLEFRGLRPATVLTAAARFAAKQFLAAGRVAADVDLLSGQQGAAADLAGQAALTSGLLACVELVPDPSVRAGAGAAAEQLLTAFADEATGAFRTVPEHSFVRHTPSGLSDLLAALRSLQAESVLATLPNPDPLQQSGALLERLLATLRPVLAHSEWETSGEVLGDGIADTNQNGVPEPSAAGGPFGRLPLLAGAILVGDAANAPPPSDAITWSQHVRPLLFEQCGTCHFSGSTQSTYRLDTRRLVAVPGTPPTGLPTLVPFDAAASLLYRKLVDRIPPVGAQMPLDGTPMSAIQREIVRSWIQTGATSR